MFHVLQRVGIKLAVREPVNGLQDRDSDQWFRLFFITRAAATILAPLLLAAHPTPHDAVLAVAGIAYGTATLVLLARAPWLQRSFAFWIVDVIAALSLTIAYGEWRSPFYLLGLTALILPTTCLAPRRALAFGSGYAVLYFGVSLLAGVSFGALSTTPRLHSFFMHLAVPLLVTVSLTYAAELMRGLERERRRSERLALEAERQRIALELHDSAKQRLHAAHLLLTAVPANGDDNGDSRVAAALRELNAATADMDTSLRDLSEPLFEGASLGAALREWAERLAAGSAVRIEVLGDAPTLPTFVSAHAYRIAREAITNAVRHAGARHVEVLLAVVDDRLHLTVTDDGCGMPDEIRPGANGLRSMYNRAGALGGELRITAANDVGGTIVALHAPVGFAGDPA